MRKIVIAFLLTILSSASVSAFVTEKGRNKADNHIKENSRPPEIIVKVNPLSLLSHYSGIMLGLEHRVYKNLFLHYEGGTVSNAFRHGLGFEEYESLRGGKGNVQLRLMIDEQPDSRLFIGIETYLRSINYDKQNTFGMDCEGFGDCAYFRYVNFKEYSRALGLGLSLGGAGIFYERIIIEYSGTLGLLHNSYTSTGKPEQFSQEYGKISVNDRPFSVIYMNLGIRLGLIAYKKMR